MKQILSCVVALAFFFTSKAQTEFVFEHFNVTNTPIFNGNNFKTVAMGKFGKIWAGSQYHGIVKYDPGSKSWSTSLDLGNVLITDIKRGVDEDVWISHSGLSGSQGGGSNIAGGINRFRGYGGMSSLAFYSITAPGGLTSRNARSVWVDRKNYGPDDNFRVWVAQGTYITSNTTTAGGISVGINTSGNVFTKIYKGLQVTPNVPAAQAGLPNCIAVGGYKEEVWVCALANFGRSQILRYRADDPGTFIGFYDYTNTPALSLGFRANAIFTDNEKRAWLGLNENGLRIKTNAGWKTMNNTTLLPFGTAINPNAITQDERGYIYFGTSSGLLIYKGGAVDSVSSYQMVTTADGLVSNQINGVAADTVNNRLVLAHNMGISFMKFNSKISSTLQWDHSFPKPAVSPVGLAADGVSRLYVKVRRGNSGRTDIKKVKIQTIAQTINGLAGKVRAAIKIDEYSNEANTGTSNQAERTDSTSSGDFYFWYVAPDDFSADSLGIHSSKGERNDTVKVKITYSDNSEDSINMPIKIVRPTLVISSMLTKAGDIVKNLKLPDGTPILQSDKFGVRQQMLNGLNNYIQNDYSLMDESGAQEFSYQRIIEERRADGIANQRVDLVAQGVAGNVQRKMIRVRRNTGFYSDDQSRRRNNYGRGYVNKFIGVNVPNNGSPLFQLINDVNTPATTVDENQLSTLINAEGEMKPYPLLATSRMGQSQLVRASVLFQYALTDSGNNLAQTDVKNHLIATELGSNGSSNMGIRNKMLQGLGSYIVNDYSMMKTAPLTLVQAANNILALPIPQQARADSFFSFYSIFKTMNNVLKKGDYISTVSSQLAGNAENAPNVTKKIFSEAEQNDHTTTLGNAFKTIHNLLNTTIHSPAFSEAIAASPTVGAIAGATAYSISKAIYDTAKIVITNREELGPESFRMNDNGITTENTTEADSTIIVKFVVKDTVQLAHVRINFQGQVYTSKSRNAVQQMPITVKRSMAYSGLHQLLAIAVYQTPDTIKYHIDTVYRNVPKTGTVTGFRIMEEEMELANDLAYFPNYEVQVNNEWQRLASNDATVTHTIENPSKVIFNTNNKSFTAAANGYSRVYFQYGSFKDTVALTAYLPFSATAINRTIINGSFKDSATWSKGRPPIYSDSIIISTGHTITLDSSVQIRSLKIETGASLTLNNSALQLQLGYAEEDGAFMIDNDGALNIVTGTMRVGGRVRLNAGATFNMTGGTLIIDGNTGDAINSLANGMFMFEALPGMASFSFTGGTLQLVDPPIGLASQAIKCPYNFGPNSILILGNGISVNASSNPDGFGGNGFPPQIGRLILDASTGSNRLLKITKPLSVKGSFQVRSGSRLQLQAPVTVSP